MSLVEEQRTRLYAMPADQIFTMKEITGGPHDPGLWMHLHRMDDGKHYREDGCLFVANQTRIRFWWQSPKEEEESNT